MIHQVRTLYACVGEHETELSFEPNAIITSGKGTKQYDYIELYFCVSVRPSLEPGWLEGNLEGKVGFDNQLDHTTFRCFFVENRWDHISPFRLASSQKTMLSSSLDRGRRQPLA